MASKKSKSPGESSSSAKATKQKKPGSTSHVLKETPVLLKSAVKSALEDAARDGSLDTLLERYQMYRKSLCPHAGQAAILAPDLVGRYATAFLKTPEEHHDAIAHTLINLTDSAEAERTYQFIAQIETSGIETALTETLERKELAIFAGADSGINKNPTAKAIKALLTLCASNEAPDRARLLALKWLPYFTRTKKECLSMLRGYLEHPDRRLGAIALLHLHRLSSIRKDIEKHHWRYLTTTDWNQDHNVSILEGAHPRTIGRTLATVLLQIATANCSPEEGIERENASATYWRDTMNIAGPTDRRLVEKALARFYECAGSPEKPQVIWFENPRMAAHAGFLLKRSSEEAAVALSAEAEKISATTSYLENLHRIIDLFPMLTENSRRTWAFGMKGWEPWPEYIPEYIWCGTPYIMGPPKRTRDLWDVISDRAIYAEPTDENIVLDRLRSALIGTEEGSRLLDYKPDTPNRDALEEQIKILFDRTRLKTVGKRAFLKKLGACPHEEDGLTTILQNCGGFIPFDRVVIALEHPVRISRDEFGRLHNASEMSIEYSDGWGCYSLHGMTVENADIIVHRDRITIDDIYKEHNAEIRRVMIEFYGLERFVHDCNAEIVDDNERFGVLYKTAINDLERVAMLKVTNRTPEPDGTFKHYFLSVPTGCRTARQAVAWTFNMSEEEYDPDIET